MHDCTSLVPSRSRLAPGRGRERLAMTVPVVFNEGGVEPEEELALVASRNSSLQCMERNVVLHA